MSLTNEKYRSSVLRKVCLQSIVFMVGLSLSFFLTDYYKTYLNPMRDLFYIFIFWVVISTSMPLNPLCIVVYGWVYDVLMGLNQGWTSFLWVLWLMSLAYQKQKIYYLSLEKKWIYFAAYFFVIKMTNGMVFFLQTQENINLNLSIQSFLFSLIFFPYVYFVLNKIYFRWGGKNG